MISHPPKRNRGECMEVHEAVESLGKSLLFSTLVPSISTGFLLFLSTSKKSTLFSARSALPLGSSCGRQFDASIEEIMLLQQRKKKYEPLGIGQADPKQGNTDTQPASPCPCPFRLTLSLSLTLDAPLRRSFQTIIGED